MSTGVPTPSRAVLIAVACSSIAAALSLTNFAASLLSWPRSVLNIPFPSTTGFISDDALVTFAVSGALAGALGLLVIRLAPSHGWTWLLGPGTLLTATLVLPLFREDRDLLSSTWFRGAIGAGPVLVLLGLLGAANWLMHASATGTGAVVAGIALTAPIPGTLVFTLLLKSQPSFSTFRAVNVTLAIIGILGALAAIILARSNPGPPVPQPSAKVTLLGVIAVALPIAPAVVERIGRQEYWSTIRTDPNGPSLSDADQGIVLMGLCGLAVFAVAVGLAAPIGVKTLGATLAAGLVLFGVQLPVLLGRFSLDSSAGLLVVLGLGLAIGIAGALSPWRTWVAGTACAITGIIVMLTFADVRPSEAVAGGLLLFGVIAAVTTFGAASEAVAEGAQAPAMLGAVAVAIQLGLSYSGALLNHSAFGEVNTRFQALALASGIALLIGALLVVAVRLVRVPADQATVSPELPVAR